MNESRYARTVPLEIFLWLLGIPTGIFATWLYDRFRNRTEDAALWIDGELVSTPDSMASSLELGLTTLDENGTTVTAPVVIDLYLWSAGRKDIQRNLFDDSEPLLIPLNAKVIRELGGGRKVAADRALVSVDSGGVRVDPSLVRKEIAIHWRLLLDGIPSFRPEEVDNPIADLRVRSFWHEWRHPTPGNVVRKIVGGALALIGLGTIVLSVFLPQSTKELLGKSPVIDLALITLGVFAALVAGILLFTTADLPSRRAQYASRRLNKVLGQNVFSWERTPQSPRIWI